MANWMTIETAPKDGSSFLSFDEESQSFDVLRWSEGIWYADRVSEIDGDRCEEFFTHWQALPESP